MQIEERIDAAGGRGGAQPGGQPVAVVHGNDAVRAEPFGVRGAGDAENRCTASLRELNGDGTDATRGTGHRDDVGGLQVHRTHRRVCRSTGDVQSAGDLPRHARRFECQLVGGDDHELRVAGTQFGEPDHLVTHGDVRDAGTHAGRHTGEVAALPGGERRGPAVVEQTTTNHGLPRIDSRRLDLDEHLPVGGLGPGHLSDLENVDVAIPVELHCSAHVSYDLFGPRPIP